LEEVWPFPNGDRKEKKEKTPKERRRRISAELGREGERRGMGWEQLTYLPKQSPVRIMRFAESGGANNTDQPGWPLGEKGILRPKKNKETTKRGKSIKGKTRKEENNKGR